MPAASSVPLIFDRYALVRALARAVSIGPADFLLAQVSEDLIARLQTTLRPFPHALDLGTPLPSLAAALSGHAPQRLILRAATLPESLSPHWSTIVCDVETLPFAPESFDLAVSAFALQSVNDLPGVLIQLRRALAPDGLLLACMLGGQSLHELRTVFAMAEEEISGGVSPRVAPFADLRDMGGLLQRAGFALPVTDVDIITVRYKNLFALMADLRAMGATNTLASRSRKPLRRAVVLRAAQLYQDMFADADGRIRATFEIVWLSGWAPHESQQKPLAPGSAKMRLADALNMKQRKSEDT